MTKLDRYLDAATRANTRRSYDGALRHFEVEAGGQLPATADQVAQYLAEYAERFSVNTLKQRLAALAGWHRDHGFVDPTRAPIVRKALKGIQALHPSVEKQATPLQLTQLGQVADWLDSSIAAAQIRGDHACAVRHLRDRSLVLLGFWRGFRGDDLLRMQAEHLQVVSGEGMTCFLPQSKGDRENVGKTYRVPALSRWCPVAATEAWIAAAGLVHGPLYRRVDRWGRIADEAIHINSFIALLRRVFTHAGLAAPEAYSGHSLRRGFAGWANANGWDIKTLMQYVGWKDINSAIRYVDSDPFAQDRIEAGLPPITTKVAPVLLAPSVVEPVTEVELVLELTRQTAKGRGRATAQRLIEGVCLARHRAQRQSADGTRFQLAISAADEAALEEIIAGLLDEMHRIADNNQCLLTAHLRELAGKRRWE